MFVKLQIMIVVLIIFQMCDSFQLKCDAQTQLIFDAAFAPDGKTRGAATVYGFQQYDRKTKALIYSYNMEKGARFLKWAPDSKRVLIATWEEGDVPTYIFLDIVEDRVISTFQDKVRWFYYHGDVINEGFYPKSISTEKHPSPVVSHYNTLRFSPNGMEITYITMYGNIIIRDTNNASIESNFLMSDHNLMSIGYAKDDSLLWAGEILSDPEIAPARTPLHYINRSTGEILQTQLFPKNVDPKDVLFSHIFDVDSEGKYALAMSGLILVHGIDGTYPVTDVRLFDLEKGDTDLNFIAHGENYFLRAIFGWTNIVYGIVPYTYPNFSDHYVRSMKYDHGNLVERLSSANFCNNNTNRIPVQPLPFDGKVFLMLGDDEFHLVNMNRLDCETVPVAQTAINNFMQYENTTGQRRK